MILMDLYKRGVGTIKKFQPVETIFEAEQALEKYCQDNNLHVIAKEKCGDSYWNYLSDGTEFDYSIEEL